MFLSLSFSLPSPLTISKSILKKVKEVEWTLKNQLKDLPLLPPGLVTECGCSRKGQRHRGWCPLSWLQCTFLLTSAPAHLAPWHPPGGRPTSRGPQIEVNSGSALWIVSWTDLVTECPACQVFLWWSTLSLYIWINACSTHT